MKTKLKLLIVLLATFCIALACGVVAACKEPEDLGNPETDGYIITVLYPDGSIVKGSESSDPYGSIYVELVDADGNRVDESAYSELNESGIAQINYFVPGEYYIKINDIPEGYVFDSSSAKTSADRARYTVSLKLDAPTPYTINLKYPYGDANMSNVTVKLMDGTDTVATATTDNNGVAVTPTIVRGNYKIVLENLPEGFGYKTASTAVNGWPVTVNAIVLKDITFEDADKLDENGIEPWDTALNDAFVGIKRFDKTGKCYEYTAEFAAKEEVFFKIHAPKTGSYTIGAKNDDGNANYSIQFYADDLSYNDSSLTITSDMNDGINVQEMQINEGKTLIFSVKAFSNKPTAAPGTVKVLICLPVPAPLSTTASKIGTYTLVFTEYHIAILNFVTGSGIGQGKYEFTSLSDKYDVMVVEYANSFPAYDDNSDLPAPYVGYAGNDNGAPDGRNFRYTKSLPASYVGNSFQYHVVIKDEVINYPVYIDVEIKRTGDATETEITKETAVAHVDTKFADQEGTFTWMPGSSLPVKRKNDGKWYVEVNGEDKALVVAITKELNGQVFSFANVEYFGGGRGESNENNQPAKEPQNNYLTVYADLETLDTTWNYTGFIETYAGRLENGKYVGGYVNSDGVYQVNDELKLFLERYMNQHYADFIDPDESGNIAKPEQPWLLGCGYYATPASDSEA